MEASHTNLPTRHNGMLLRIVLPFIVTLFLCSCGAGRGSFPAQDANARAQGSPTSGKRVELAVSAAGIFDPAVADTEVPSGRR
jgi:hypothetical protein